MYRCGIDLTEIARIGKSIGNPRFLEKVFSQKEREMFQERGNPVQTIAANFSAKEAFSKALGTGIRGFSLWEISVLRDELGAPYFEFAGKAEEIVRREGLAFSLSLTHAGGMACAMVVAYPKTE